MTVNVKTNYVQTIGLFYDYDDDDENNYDDDDNDDDDSAPNLIK